MSLVKQNVSHLIESKEQWEAYARLCKTCFESDALWTDKLYPLAGKGSYALGRYSEKNVLLNAAASVRFPMHYYGDVWPVSGISAVASSPADRGQGAVQDLLSEILKKEYRDGQKMSFLYPFNHGFYNKTGFGTLTDCHEYSFKPEDIDSYHPEGQWEPLIWSPEVHEEMIDCNNRWISDYQGGIPWPFREYDDEVASAKHFKGEYYLYRNSGGELKAWICYSRFKAEGQEVLSVYKTVWDGPESFRAVFFFLSRFRSQIQRIVLKIPETVPLRLIMKNGHITKKGLACWMGRPLDVAAVLQQKLNYEGFDGSFSFSLRDPVLEENTGTYRIEGGMVRKTAEISEQEIPFHLAAELILSGKSLFQLTYAGVLSDTSFPLDMYRFFSRYENIFFSEMF